MAIIICIAHCPTHGPGAIQNYVHDLCLAREVDDNPVKS